MSYPSSGLQALLRDACRRALGLGLSFTNQLRLYRSILALAREARLRSGGAVPDTAGQALPALLAAVCEHAAELGLDPELPLPDAILIQRLVVQLSRAVRLATVGEPIERPFLAHHAMHREEPAPREAAVPPTEEISPQHAMHREDAAPPEAAESRTVEISPQYPMHRETEADDDRLSAWRKDHTTDRDQRAHEKVRTVIDERVIAKIKAMNRRDREERAAAA